MITKLKKIIHWFTNCAKFLTFLNKNVKESLSRESLRKDNDYVIVIEPWKLTPVPWYAITLAFLLIKKGYKVKVLLNDLHFGDRFDHTIQVFAIKFILKRCSAYLKTDILSAYLDREEIDNVEPLAEHEITEIRNLAFANAVHRNRGEVADKEFLTEVEDNYSIYLKNYCFIRDYISEQNNSTFLIPGGICGYSGLVLFGAKENRKKFITYDAGFGVLLTSVSGVAAHCGDIPLSLDYIMKENNQEQITKAKVHAHEELEKRINGTNSFKTQYQSIEDSVKIDDVGFLIPLNSPWDSAMLNIDYLFKSYREWLIETVKFILKNTEDNITIRQHPDERHWYGRSNIDFGEIVSKEFNRNPRIQYLSCYDKVNTYTLLEKSKAVICFSSTFGIEAVLHNKHVIVCSNVYYSSFSFVIKPKTINELSNVILNLSSLPDVSVQDRDLAAVVFYLGQKCNWLHTRFTPTVTDFDFWSQKKIVEIEMLPDVQLLLNVIENSMPLSYLQHKQMI